MNSGPRRRRGLVTTNRNPSRPIWHGAGGRTRWPAFAAGRRDRNSQSNRSGGRPGIEIMVSSQAPRARRPRLRFDPGSLVVGRKNRYDVRTRFLPCASAPSRRQASGAGAP